MLKPGVRIVRGPNWCWDNEDGGEGHVGTVSKIGTSESDNVVIVQWDNGNRTNCRVGYLDKYDIRVIDNAQIGVKHRRVTCDICNTEGMCGIRYKCNYCYDYDLCYICYHGDKHDRSHSFKRLEFPGAKGINLPPRLNATKRELRGIFKGATVVRGFDWEWNNQDGGEGKTGVVVDVRGWEHKTYRSTVDVNWTYGNRNFYRLGHKGYSDVKCLEASSGGYYYPDHLPILGQSEEQMEWNLLIDTIEIEQVKELERKGQSSNIVEKLPEGWKEERACTLSLLDPISSFYAAKIMDYNNFLIRSSSSNFNLVHEFSKICEEINDNEIKDIWEITKYMTHIPVVSQEDVCTVRYDNAFMGALAQQGKKYLEDRYKKYMISVVSGTTLKCDVSDNFRLVHEFLGLRFKGDYLGLQDGLVEGRPLWPMVYYCLRLGDIAAAVFCLRNSTSKFMFMTTMLETKLNIPNSDLILDLEDHIKFEYRNTVRNETDPFKRMVWALLGCDSEISEIITTEDDYLWSKLNLIRVDGHGLRYDDFQYEILEELGESHYNAMDKPFLYFKLLALTGQFEAATEFLFRTEKFRVHAVHMAIALNEMNLLALPQDDTLPLMSIDSSDPQPARRLNMALLINSYINKFETHGALNYLHMLRNCKDTQGQNIFEIGVSDLAINTKQYEEIFGKFQRNGFKTKGLIDQFNNANITIKNVAQNLINKGLYEEAIDLYSNVNNQEGVLSLMCTMLVRVAHLESSPDSPRERLKEKAVNFDKRFSKEGYNTTIPDIVNSFIKLKDLLIFFDLYRVKQYPEALKALIKLEIVPLRYEELHNRVENMKNLTDDFYNVLPDVLLATMTILVAQCDKIKKTYGPEINDDIGEEHLRTVWEQANCIANFAEKIPKNLSKTTTNRLVQMEILMHS